LVYICQSYLKVTVAAFLTRGVVSESKF